MIKLIWPRKRLLKNELPEKVQEIQEAHPDDEIEVWAEDEHRMGTKPIVRRVWAPKGQRPIAVQRRGYKWLYVYAFVHPETGRAETYLLPTVNIVVFGIALALLAQAVGAGQGKQVIIVMDRAGWHKSEKLVIPDGIHLIFQPANSPEVQPAENMWDLLDEVVANCLITDIDELEELVAARCRDLPQMTEQISSRTLFPWWPCDNLS